MCVRIIDSREFFRIETWFKPLEDKVAVGRAQATVSTPRTYCGYNPVSCKLEKSRNPDSRKTVYEASPIRILLL